jgi:hypothetical protein
MHKALRVGKQMKLERAQSDGYLGLAVVTPEVVV